MVGLSSARRVRIVLSDRIRAGDRSLFSSAPRIATWASSAFRNSVNPSLSRIGPCSFRNPS